MLSLTSDHRLTALLAGLSIGLLLIIESLAPYYFLESDNAAYYLPAYVYNWRSVVENGALPFVTFHQALGQTYLGQGQSGVLYFAIYPAVGLSYLLFDHPYATIDVLAIAHLAGAAVAAYWLLRQWRRTPFISFMLALWWITVPAILGLAKDWIIVTYFAFYLPLNWLLLERWLRKPTPARAIMLGAAKALLLLTGYVQYGLILLEFEVLYLILLGWQRHQWRLGRWLKRYGTSYILSLAAMLLISAPLLASMWSAQILSYERSGRLDLYNFIGSSISLRDFVLVQFGRHLEADMLPQPYTAFAGLGIIVVLIGLLSPGFVKQSEDHRFLLFSVLAATALILSTPVYGLLNIVPGLHYFRGALKHAMVADFFILASAAIVLQAGLRRFRQLPIATFLLLVIMIATNIGVVWANRVSMFAHTSLSVPPSVDALPILDRMQRYYVYRGAPQKERDFDHRYLVHNYATLFDHYNTTGYDSLISNTNQYLSHDYLDELTDSWSLAIERKDEILEYWRKWGVSHIITTDSEPEVYELTQLGLVPVYRRDYLLVYEVPGAYPLVRSSENPTTGLAYTIGTNHIRIQNDRASAHVIEVAIAALPNYYLWIDGVFAGPIPATDDVMRLALPPGGGQVTIKFIDIPFLIGLGFSVLGTMALLLWHVRRHLRAG